MKTVGVIGLGSIGMRHAKNLMAMGHNVVGFDPEVAAEDFPSFWKPWPQSRMGDLDAIVIASPTSMHQSHVCDALNTTRNILVEKPISDRWTENTDLLTLVTMVGYNLRYHSCVKKAKEWLGAGIIGKPIWANFTLGQYNDRPHYLCDGVILNWSHELDLALYLLGSANLASSSTHITGNGQDDLTDILLMHENGCRSTVHLDYVTQPEHRYFTIVGTKSAIRVNIVNRFADLVESNPKDPSEPILKEHFMGRDTWNDNYIEEIQEFLAIVDNPDAPSMHQRIGCTGKEALDVLKICLQVREQAGLA
jgi:predicted dehydrogenase